MKVKTVHPDFCLNGISYTGEVLKDAAYSFIKEGKPFEKAIGNFLCDWLNDSSTIEVQTSGSTGTPKRILLEKQKMMNSALATGSFFNLRPGNSALLCLSAEYIAGKMMLVRAMVLGLHLEIMAPNSNPLQENGKDYDFGAMVPLQLQNAMQQIGCIKILLVGGAPLSHSIRKKLKTVTSHVYETYGMTETITHVAVKKTRTAQNAATESKSFKALPKVTFSIDQRNCLVIDAPMVSDEQIITNDVVQLISKTAFEWLGRFDNIINSGGVKLFPEQIEEKLATVIDQRFFVTGISDNVLGQKLILLVEGEMDADNLLRDMAGLASIKKYELPKEAYSLVNFVETKSGKIDRNQIIEHFKKGPLVRIF